MARSAADPDSQIIAPERGATYGSITFLSDPWAFRLLWLGYVILLIGSWRRWTQPIVDHGREMNLPARIAAGEALYQDVQYLYGPLAPQLNALLFSVFGLRLGVLHVAGAICAALILFLIYHVARQVMDPLESLVTTSLVLVLCAVKSTANYISPYSYAALYGVALALISLWFALKYWREGGGRAPFWAGIFAGLALITKWEIALAAVAAGLVALLLSSLSSRRLLWTEWLRFLFPVLAIPSVVFVILVIRVPLKTLIEDNHIFFSNMPPQLIYFNRHVSGLAEFPASLWFMLSGLGMFVFWCGMIIALGALTSRQSTVAARRLAAQGAIVAICGALWWAGLCLLFKVDWDASLLTGMPLVIPAIVGLYGWQALSSWISGTAVSTKTGIVLVIAVFAQLAILRFILNMKATGPYVPFAIPVVIVLCAYLLLRLLPAVATTDDRLRVSMRNAGVTLLAVLAIGIGINSVIRFRSRNTFEVSSLRGRFVTEKPIGQPLAEAIEFARTRASENEDVLTLPQATVINFMAGRRYPFREEIIHPGFLSDGEAIHRIEARPPKLILIVNLLTPEFRDRVFGVDYNPDLMKWIEQNYRLTARFDSDWSRGARWGDNVFFVLAFER
jgi:Dolichyl-phosphate-mannose-protein mannosyltransferase